MTDDELRTLVAQNAAAIGRNTATIDRNATAIEQNAAAIAQTAELARQNTETAAQLVRKTQSIDKMIAATQQQLDLLGEQTRSLADNQDINESRFTRAERQIQGIYDLFGTLAKEQAARSQLIDQQIQALIDERRRS